MKNTIFNKIAVAVAVPVVMSFLAACAYAVIVVYRYMGAGGNKDISSSEPMPDIAVTVAVMAAVFAVILIFVMIALFAAIKRITKQIKDIAAAAEAIAGGDWEAYIPGQRGISAETDTLSASLFKISEQFRINAMLHERYGNERSVLISLMDAIGNNRDAQKAAASLSECLKERFGADFVKFIIIKNMAAVDIVTGRDFTYNQQVISTIGDKDILFLNNALLEQNDLKFQKGTSSLLILPLRDNEELIGYIIFTMCGDTHISISEGNENTLRYASRILVNWIKNSFPGEDEHGSELKTEPAFEQQNPDSDFVSAMRRIDSLDIDYALSLMDGINEIYENAVIVMADIIPETIANLGNFLNEGDTKNFAIEVHGLKSAMLNIGAKEISAKALELENAAKSNNLAFCIEKYPEFEHEVMVLLDDLEKFIP